jgi:hypothetical protein
MGDGAAAMILQRSGRGVRSEKSQILIFEQDVSAKILHLTGLTAMAASASRMPHALAPRYSPRVFGDQRRHIIPQPREESKLMCAP